MAQFEPGKVIKTDFGAPIKIIKYLAGGGRGDAYIVEYDGYKKVLMWYKPQALKDPNIFYDNLKCIIDKGSPGKAFLWPEAITERIDGSFGYIMDLKPTEYCELSATFASAKYHFKSFKVIAETCIHIVSAFNMLHNYDYSFQDITLDKFLINPQNGDTLICFDDNTFLNGFGKPRYMAPEIVVGKGNVLPNTQTDRFSLAVILFLILFMNHPLEGKRSLVPCLTSAEEEKIYGSEALFIYDPNDKSNAPVENLHANVIARWGFMPDYIKDAFLTAFSQQTIKEPDTRLTEFDWLKVFVRFRSDVVKCSCGNEVFIKDASTTHCDECGKPVTISRSIQLPEYAITAVKGSCIYRCQLGVCNANEALTPVALVVAQDDAPGVLGFKNMTTDILKATTPSGKMKQVQPQEVVPFKIGIVIEAFGSKIQLK